ncbi:unnamed protein product [Peniophora sp. CBMAI 1063]|nr:unnamed protein product [Peniophora sp. CBMAI 1063]
MSDLEVEDVLSGPADSDDAAGGDVHADNPGARTFWFGKNRGRRLDAVVQEDLGYAEWCCHPDRKKEQFKWYDEFCRLYSDYEAWLERTEGPINPGQAVVWFGKWYRNCLFATMYNAPGHVRYLLDNDKNKPYKWYYWLERQTQKMDDWRNGHRRSYRARGPSDKVRDVGLRLTRKDDGAIDSNEEYEKDGFVVSDEEDDGPNEDPSSSGITECVNTDTGHSQDDSQIESIVSTNSRVGSQAQDVQTQTSGDDIEEVSDESDFITSDGSQVDDDADYQDDDDYDPLDAIFKGKNAPPPPHTQMQTRSMARKEQKSERVRDENMNDEAEQSDGSGLTTVDAEDDKPRISPRTRRRLTNADLSDEEEGPSRRLHKRLRIDYDTGSVTSASDAGSKSEDSDSGPRPSKGRRSTFGKLMDPSSQETSAVALKKSMGGLRDNAKGDGVEIMKNRTRAQYPFFLTYRTRWSDNDQYGHMNNSVYYHLFDSIINSYLIAHCGLEPTKSERIGLVVESHCSFFAPLAFPEVLELGLRVVALGRSSVTYEVGVWKEGSQKVAAVGGYTHVFVDSDSRRTGAIEGGLRDGLGRLLVDGAGSKSKL